MYLSCISSVDPETNVDTDDYDAIQQWASSGTVTGKSNRVPHSVQNRRANPRLTRCQMDPV